MGVVVIVPPIPLTDDAKWRFRAWFWQKQVMRLRDVYFSEISPGEFCGELYRAVARRADWLTAQDVNVLRLMGKTVGWPTGPVPCPWIDEAAAAKRWA